MEEITLQKNDINSKLLRETGNLLALKNSLASSVDQTHRMLDILNKFDTRLHRLECTIMPIYQETGILQRRQDNIKQVNDCLDDVISYYHVVNQAEPIISKGPCEYLPTYLDTMDVLQTAAKFFSHTNDQSEEFATITALYEGGKSALEREFRSKLEKASKPLPAIIITDCIEQDSDLNAALPDQMSIETLDYLSSIATWLQNCGLDSTHALLYQKTRSKVIADSLKGLTDHMKSSSRDSMTSISTLSTSPSLSNKLKTPTKEQSSTRKVLNRYLTKATDQIKHRITSETAGFSTPTSQSEVKNYDIDTRMYICTVKAFIKLIQSEQKMMHNIISESNSRQVFNRIIQVGLESIFSEGEKIANTIKKRAAGNDFMSVNCLFPILKYLRESKSTYEKILEGYPAPTRTKFASLIATLDYNGVIVLNQYIDSIKIGIANMPKDGTVHELTSNTIIFMEQLMLYSDTVGSMLLAQDPTSLQNTQNLKRPKLKLAEFINKILRSLSDNLVTRSASITDVTLRSIFMLNNYNHILKSLKSSGLLSIVNEWNDTIVGFFNTNILDQKRIYSQRENLLSTVILSEPFLEKIYCDYMRKYSLKYRESWSGVYEFIKEDKSIHDGKLKDKDRQLIKDKFVGFNREFDELHRVQRSYAIPDVELRQQIRKDNVNLIKPKYYQFLRRYIPLQFTKNIEKYKKYTDTQVEQLIMEFFESSL